MPRREATPPNEMESGSDFHGESGIAREVSASIEILVADGDRATREGAAALLRSVGYAVSTAGTSDEALVLACHRRFDLLLLDARLPGVGGLDVMRAVLGRVPEAIVVVTTIEPSVSSSLEALRAGAWDYLPKPFTASHLEILAGRATHDILAGRNRPLPFERQKETPEAGVFGSSPDIARSLELARRVAPTSTPVLLVSEGGTGKGRLARYIHARSSRARNVFLLVDCGRVTSEELFGRSGLADESTPDGEAGLLDAAAGGTLFFNDLAELAPQIQEELVRTIERGTLPRARYKAPTVPLNVRFISAVRDGPGLGVRSGRVRRDLLQLLAKVTVRIAALRERADDIPVIAEHLLECCWTEHHGAESLPPPRLSAATREWLKSLPWPGNVRQLWRVMERVSMIADAGAEIEPEDVPMVTDAAEEAAGGIYAAILDDVYAAAKDKLIQQFEREYLPRLVGRAQGNMARAARMAEVDRKTLYRLLEKHGMKRPSPPSGTPQVSDDPSGGATAQPEHPRS